jgi:soluble lytic murein transglycosylase-like protein
MRLIIFLLFFCNFSYSETPDLVIRKCSKVYKGDCTLVASIAYVESRYNPNAYNPEGSYGIMQIRCSTARMMGMVGNCSQLFNIDTNLKYSIKYIENLKKRFIKMTDVIAAYNSGTPIICKDYNFGKCYSGEYYNQQYVNKVSLKYLMIGIIGNAPLYSFFNY